MRPITNHILHHSERGDTIVEVLISIAVITTILTGAYIVTNHSLLSARDAQERGNALTLSQGQLERLKTVAATKPDLLFDPSAINPFCINDLNVPVDVGDATCTVDANGTPVPSSKQPAYNFTITRVSNTFTIRTTWSSILGNTTNNVQLSYKVYK